MVNWNSWDVKAFKKQARMFQQEYCDLLGDREWDVIESYEWDILRRKVGYGIYGPPSRTPRSKNRYTGYSKAQLEVIEKICDQLVENLNFIKRDIHFACIFVVMKVHEKRYTVPVFKSKRPKQKSKQCVFVDTGARKYTSWDDYLETNTLEKCIYCYPSYGEYVTGFDNEVSVDFGTSPACDLRNRVLSGCDSTASLITNATAVVGVAALCGIPIAGPIVAATAIAGASTGAYGVARNVGKLYDRATHHERIDFSDPEARQCWLALVGSTVGYAQGRLLKSISKAAEAGVVVAKAGRIAFLVVQTGSLTLNGIGIVYSLAALTEKYENDELTTLDICKFSASVLFFTNSIVHFETASMLIERVQRDVIRYGGPSPRKPTLSGPGPIQRNTEDVKQPNHIEDVDELYEMMTNSKNDEDSLDSDDD